MTSSRRIPTVRTVRPRSAATPSHGPTFASWSSPVTTSSSPGCRPAVIERATCIVSVVMFAPNLISSGLGRVEQVRERRVRLVEDRVGLRSEVANVPPWFAFEVR